MSTYTIKDISDAYVKYNAELFSNKLPEIPIKIGKAKRTAAYIRSSYTRSNGIYQIKYLNYSNYYKRSKESFHAIIIHEMIHVYLIAIKGSPRTSGSDKSHGYEFMEKLRELEIISGLNIPVVCEEKLEVADVRTTPYDILIVKKSNGTRSIISMSKKMASNRARLVADLSDIMILNPNFTSIIIAKSTNPAIENYPKKRAFTSLYRINDKLNNIENELTSILRIGEG